MAESGSDALREENASDIAESAEDTVKASLEDTVTDPGGTTSMIERSNGLPEDTPNSLEFEPASTNVDPSVDEENGDTPGLVGLPESCVDQTHNGHSSPDLADLESSGNGTTVPVANQGNMLDDGKQDEVTSAKTVSNTGGEMSLKTSLDNAGRCSGAKDSDEGVARSSPTDPVAFGAEEESKMSRLTETSDRQQVTDGKVTVSSPMLTQDGVYMEDPPTAPCDIDISEVENDDDAEKSMKASKSTTYADMARVKEPEVPIKPSSPSSTEDEPKSSDRPGREGKKYTESSPKDSATPPKPGDISEDEPKNIIRAEEPKKIENLISPKPADSVVPPNMLAVNNETQSSEECPEKSCAKKLDKLTEDGESATPKEDGASANQPGNEIRETAGSEQSKQLLQIEKSKTMSNVVNNSLDNIQQETASSDNAESDELQTETASTSEQLPDDSIPKIQGNNSEHEVVVTSDPETETVAAGSEVRKRTVSHQSPLTVNSPPPRMELHRAELHTTTKPAQDPLPLHGDSTRPSHPTDEKSDTSKPDEGPTKYVPPKRQPTNCERMMNIIILLLATITLFGGVMVFLYISDYGESNILETVQDNSFTVNEETIVLQSQLWDGEELNILVIGRLGTGKSTLLRGLFEENGHVAPLSLDRNREKPPLDQKRLHVNDVPISLSVWNHPKLENVGAIIKTEELQKFDVILYTIKMSETRFPPKDSNIMKTMLEILGTDFVSKTVFILSHANQVGSLDNQNVHQKTKSILESKTGQWKEMIINKLNEHSKEDLKPEHFVHAGHPNQPNLYDVHWPSQVLAVMFDQLDESRRPALAKACEKYWISALQGNYKPGSCAS